MNSTALPVLFVSTGRTGTGFFCHLLRNLFPQVEVHHNSRYTTWINIVTNMLLARVLPKDALAVTWKFLKEGELNRCQQNFYIDSNNHLYGLVVLAPELYPDLKVVHIVRDPRTYVRSHLNWARHRPKSFIANYMLPFWQPNAFLLGEMPLRQWLALSKFEEFCWVWDFKNRYIQSLEHSEVPYLRIRFEDLFASPDPETSLNQMLCFIGLPEVTGMAQQFDHPLNVTKKRSFPDWREWEPARCARLHELCGTMMSRYGYGREPEWTEKVQIGQRQKAQKIKEHRI